MLNILLLPFIYLLVENENPSLFTSSLIPHMKFRSFFLFFWNFLFIVFHFLDGNYNNGNTYTVEHMSREQEIF